MSLIRSVNDDLKCGQFAPAGGGQFAPADVVKINRQVVVSLLWRELFFLSGLSTKCIKCGAYAKFNGGLCYKCFSEKSRNDNIESENEEIWGLTDKDWTYRYGMIKGRIAETLIQELFLSLGYNVFRYGMENTIPGIMELLKGVRSDVAQEIRRMPDFVIQNPKSKDVYFIEVKFRASGEFRAKDLPKDYPYTNAYIILVSKKHIKCLTVEELNTGMEITPESRNYLGNRKEFGLDKDVIIDFCNFAVQFFDTV